MPISSRVRASLLCFAATTSWLFIPLPSLFKTVRHFIWSHRIAASLGNCSLHPIVTSVCVIPSHLISCRVFSAFFTSSHLISCLLSLSHLFLADHKVSHTHFLLMLVLSMKIMPYYEIQTQATATTSISWARHHPLCKSMIRPWPGPSCTRPREDLPRPSSEARFVLQNIRFLASAISQKRISCETSLKKSKLKIWKRSFRARCPLKNEIWSCNHCSDNHCSDFHCSDNHCCDNQCCWQSLCDF